MVSVTPDTARNAVYQDQLTLYEQIIYEKIGQLLQDKYGPTPNQFNLTYWLYENINEAKQLGWTDKFIKENLEVAYIQLLSKFLRNDETAGGHKMYYEIIANGM